MKPLEMNRRLTNFPGYTWYRPVVILCSHSVFHSIITSSFQIISVLPSSFSNLHQLFIFQEFIIGIAKKGEGYTNNNH